MKQPIARRAFATALILSLIASLAPQRAYAQLARGANAGAGRSLPATGLPGAAALGGPSAISLSLSAPSLSGSPSAPQNAPRLSVALSAPALAPAAAALASAHDAPSGPRSEEGAAAPAASPASPLASAAAPSAAAKEAAPAAVPERHTAMGVLKSLLSRAGAAPAGALPEGELSGRVFDGSAAKAEAADTVAARQGRAASWVLSRFEKNVARRQRDSDDFGGPKPLGPTTRLQKVGYGAKWGLNMVGIAALFNVLLAPVIAAVPWPAFLSDGLLEGAGRVALLISAGPQEIVAGLSLAPATFLGLPLIAAAAALLAARPLARALTASGPLAKAGRPVKALVYGGAAAFAVFAFLSAPGSFLGMSLPVMAAFEEISFRVLSFLPTFALLALTRPVLNWVADHLDAVPNHAGVRGGFQSVLRLLGGTVAWFAYPIAATMAAMAFAAAHFANWGVDPFVYITQFTMGMILTRVAYRSESLSAPITAHLTFNLLSLGGLALAAIGLTGLAATYSVLIAVLGGVALLYNYLSHRRDQAASRKGLFPGSRALSVLLLAGLIGTGTFHGGANDQSLVRGLTDRSSVVLAQETAPERAGVPAPPAAQPATTAAPAPVESRADVIARVSPSVFKVVVGGGLGTGFILTPQGLAASNAHVVGATPVGGFVMAHVDGLPPVRVKVLAVNHDRDIALLQLPRHPAGAWQPVPLARTAPRVGDETLAIGFPLGLDKTVTRGIVSGLGRHHSQYVAHIQTDASINPGNSGGPLFNERGEVIGMNTFIVTRTGTSIGLGFAIIGPDLARTVAQFAATSDISSGRLGIIANLSDPLKPEAGLQIEYVRPGSGAEKAGLQRGDLILRIGDQLLVDQDGEGAARGIASVLAQSIPGQKVHITVLRGEQTVTVEVAIDAKPSYPGS